jgi:hypothetical protein
MRIGIILVALLLALIIFKNEIIKSVVSRRIRAETGMDAKIGTFDVALFSPTVTIKNFKLYNTAEFGGSVLLDIPEFHLEYDRNALSLHKLRLILLRFNLAELHTVKNQGGQLNVTSLMNGMQTRVARQNNGKIGGTKYEFEGIDTLELTLGRLKTTDLGHPGKNEVREIGWTNQVVSNVKSIGDLYGGLFLIMLKQGRIDFPKRPNELTNELTKLLPDPLPAPTTNEPAGK